MTTEIAVFLGHRLLTVGVGRPVAPRSLSVAPRVPTRYLPGPSSSRLVLPAQLHLRPKGSRGPQPPGGCLLVPSGARWLWAMWALWAGACPRALAARAAWGTVTRGRCVLTLRYWREQKGWTQTSGGPGSGGSPDEGRTGQNVWVTGRAASVGQSPAAQGQVSRSSGDWEVGQATPGGATALVEDSGFYGESRWEAP